MKPWMKRMMGVLAAGGLGLTALVGCAGDTPARGGNPQGGEVLLPSDWQAGARTADIPEGARVIADAERERFLLVLSEPARSYALARTVSCDAASPVRVERAITCLGPDGALGVPEVGYAYLPLHQPAASTGDADLLRATEASLKPLTGGGAEACGSPRPEDEAALTRFAEEMHTELRGSSQRGVPVIARFQSVVASVRVPVALLGGAEAQSHAGPAAMSEPDAENSVTCRCVNPSTSTCPKKDVWIGGFRCDASNCQSCEMKY